MQALKILVIENDDITRKALEIKLGKKGIEVDTAEDGQSGLDKVHGGNYDAILLDLLMPVKSGFDVLKELKADQKYKQIPVIVLSNLSHNKEKTRSLEMGAAAYLSKATTDLERIGETLLKVLAEDNTANEGFTE